MRLAYIEFTALPPAPSGGAGLTLAPKRF